jgi:hypothetical protein
MKKLISVLVLTCLLFGTAFAEIWYPFGLTVEDDYISARAKVTEAMKGQNVDDSRFSSLLVKTTSYYLYDVPIEQILVNRPSGTEWRLMISSEDMLREPKNERNIYLLYTELVKKLGKPKEFSPAIKKTSFDGEILESIFKDEKTFLAEVDKGGAQESKTITATFENCELRIECTPVYHMNVYLYFTK